MKYVVPFRDVRLSDVARVGGKNASLGQLIANVTPLGINIPAGFAVTAAGYWHYLDTNKLREQIRALRAQLHDLQNGSQLHTVATNIRELIEHGQMPEDLADEITQAYQDLSRDYMVDNVGVAVRSSATAEDLPNASFAGQHESYLNVRGIQDLLAFCKKCFASLFTDRAIVYRAMHKFDDMKVALSIGVQKMVRSDKAAAGVVFSLDPETGFKDVVVINGSYGFGEKVVKGETVPDEFMVYKPLVEQGFPAIIQKDSSPRTDTLQKFCISDEEILIITRAAIAIEKLYSQLKKSWCPMDIEWAKDGDDGRIYIVQARPETVHTHAGATKRYTIDQNVRKQARVIIQGNSIGQKIVSGRVRVVTSVDQIERVQIGDIIVTDMTDPAWVSAMKRCTGIITNRGGRTCHAAIVSRELGIPAIVGCGTATTVLKDGQEVTIDCSLGATGYVYEGLIPFKVGAAVSEVSPKYSVPVMVNISNPRQAFTLSFLPAEGVGLARTEFIISSMIGIHPMAIVYPEEVQDASVVHKIELLSCAYVDQKTFFIDTLAHAVGMIAAAFFPKKVMVRFSDFKSNEYRNLLGGTYFEQNEENPMLGLRGASRYYHERYRRAFALECAAIKKARELMGFSNISIMIPFVRTVQEARRVLDEMGRNGLVRSKNGLEVSMMVELPANVLCIDEYATLFDNFSLGSNDLTQLTLGVDRDSPVVAPLFDEQNEAVKKLLTMAIAGAKKRGRRIGICGQGPSDYPEFAEFLIATGIDYLSLNADAM